MPLGSRALETSRLNNGLTLNEILVDYNLHFSFLLEVGMQRGDTNELQLAEFPPQHTCGKFLCFSTDNVPKNNNVYIFLYCSFPKQAYKGVYKCKRKYIKHKK